MQNAGPPVRGPCALTIVVCSVSEVELDARPTPIIVVRLTVIIGIGRGIAALLQDVGGRPCPANVAAAAILKAGVIQALRARAIVVAAGNACDRCGAVYGGSDAAGPGPGRRAG